MNDAQLQQLRELLTTAQYQEARPLVITTYERDKIEGQRETALLLLETKFGQLSPEVKQRVEGLSAEQLRRILEDFVKAPSLRDLRLED